LLLQSQWWLHAYTTPLVIKGTLHNGVACDCGKAKCAASVHGPCATNNSNNTCNAVSALMSTWSACILHAGGRMIIIIIIIIIIKLPN
jgi:hypothetical protein